MKPRVFAKRDIKKVRLGKGLSQGRLAELAGVSRQYLCDVENRKRNVGPILATKISEILGKPYQELFFVQDIDSRKTLIDNCKG